MRDTPASPAVPRRPDLRERLNHPLHLPLRLWAESLWHRPVEVLFLATLLIGLAGASLFWLVERHSPAATLHSWWDALWLVATSINENYGDVRPTTSAGRLVSAVVATLGVLLFGSFTAVVTNYLLGSDQREVLTALDEVTRRLERIERQLDARAPDGDA